MDIMIVCGGPASDAGAVPIGIVAGVLFNIVLWARHRTVILLPAARYVFPVP